MLVLTQKVGEAVHIGEGILVRVLSIDNGQVRIGYEAPKDVNIIRAKLKKQLEDAGIEVKPTKDNVVRPAYRNTK